MGLLDRIFDWLEKNLPMILLSFGLGYKEGTKEKNELEKKLLEEKLARAKAENKNEISEKYAGLSDDDVVIDLASGRKIR